MLVLKKLAEVINLQKNCTKDKRKPFERYSTCYQAFQSIRYS